MTTEEYTAIQKLLTPSHALITGDDLTNREDRTLLFGYTCERETHHVYIKNGIILCVRYSRQRAIQIIDVDCNEAYVPDRRLYPARCDFEFCYKLRLADVHLSFTTYDDAEKKRPLIAGCYFGEILNHTNHGN